MACHTYQSLILSSLLITLLSGVLLAQEGAKSDQVVLNQDILLSELFLSQPAPLFFPRFDDKQAVLFNQRQPLQKPSPQLASYPHSR